MNTRQISVSFVVNADGHIALRDLEIGWIERDSAEAIADDIEDAILNIE
jgi:hypothetical protein